jgi:hypothetical protein
LGLRGVVSKLQPQDGRFPISASVKQKCLISALNGQVPISASTQGQVRSISASKWQIRFRGCEFQLRFRRLRVSVRRYGFRLGHGQAWRGFDKRDFRFGFDRVRTDCLGRYAASGSSGWCAFDRSCRESSNMTCLRIVRGVTHW